MLRMMAGTALVVCCMATAVQAADKARGGQMPAPIGDYRLHARVATSPHGSVVDGPGSRLRTGFGGSLVGLYPLPGSGFHLSAGGRLFGRAGRPRTADAVSEPERLLAVPRGAGMAAGRGGRRRPSPAMLVGLDRPVGEGLTLGLDGGAALGRLYSSPGRLGRLQSDRGMGSAGRLNQLGRVTMLYRF